MSGVNCHMLISQPSVKGLDADTQLLWLKEYTWAVPQANALISSCRPTGQFLKLSTLLKVPALSFLMDHR